MGVLRAEAAVGKFDAKPLTHLSTTITGRRLEGQTSSLYDFSKLLLQLLKRMPGLGPLWNRLPENRALRMAVLAALGAVFLRALRKPLSLLAARHRRSAVAQQMAICSAAPDAQHKKAVKAVENGKAGKAKKTAASLAGKKAVAQFERPSKLTWADLTAPVEGTTRWQTGTMETLGMIASSTAACLVMGRQGRLIGLMEEAQILKDRKAFRWLLLQYPICCATAAAFVSFSDYLKSRLALEWRRLATKRLHDLYFSNMSYYKILHDHNRGAFDDADARICSDLKEVATSQAAVLHSFASSATMSLVFSAQIKATIGSWQVALVSPAVVFILLPFMVSTLPNLLGFLDMSWVHGKRLAATAAYRNALSRLQMHGQRVLMLQGGSYELETLDLKLKDAGYWQLMGDRATSAEEGMAGLIFSPTHSMGLGAGLCLLFPTIRGLLEGIARGEADPKNPFSPYVPKSGALEEMMKYTQSLTYSLFALKSWAGCLTALLSSKSSEGARQRVLCLAQRLQDLSAEASSESRQEALQESGDACISFQGVAVQTPSGQLLLQKLSFEVRQGQSMLISGHNGAGKSSIVRCLCNLWPIPSGCVLRPGGSRSPEEDERLHQQVFYLPQKAVSVVGTLSDMLTYPLRLPGGLEEEELRAWLRYVDLEYLVDRETASATTRSRSLRRLPSGTPQRHRSWSGGPEAEIVDWSKVLSTGELQALGIARLFYHHPRFAILDECTSAVSRELERRLFELTRELGMSVISIAHRPALEDLHGRMLKLNGNMAEDGRGWHLQDLPVRQKLEAAVPEWCESSKEAHQRIAAYFARQKALRSAEPEGEPEAGLSPACSSETTTSEPLEAGEPLPVAREPISMEEMVMRRWPTSFSRARAILSLSLAQHGSRRKAAIHGLVWSGLLIGRVKVYWELWKALASVVRAALCGDLRALRIETMSYMILQPALAFMDHSFRRTTRSFFHLVWQGIGSELHRRAVAKGLFVKTMQQMHVRSMSSDIAGLPDPIQRIAEVADVLPEACQQVEMVVPQIAMGLAALPMLIAGSWGSTFSLVALPACGGLFWLVSCIVAPDWSSISKEAAALETNYQELHTRLRRIAEPVAFNGGGAAERRTVEPAFEAVQAFDRASLKDEFLHNCATVMLTNFDFLPQLVTRLLNYDFAVRNNPDPALGLAPETVFVTLLYSRVIDFVRSGLLCLGPAFRSWHRIDGALVGSLELVEALRLAERSEASAPGRGTWRDGMEALEISPFDLRVQEELGKRAALASGVKLQLRPGQALLVTGPSGCGKSLLAAELLSVTAGSRGTEQQALMGTAPQHIYLPAGTLGDQVCYPERFTAATLQNEARLLRALKASGLAYLLGREEAGWWAERNWDEVLSGGEQQRLQLARLVYHRPRFALLDDCTSMVASDAEEGLYRALLKKYGVTPVTLTQRAFLPSLYGEELRLGLPTRKGWSLVESTEQKA